MEKELTAMQKLIARFEKRKEKARKFYEQIFCDALISEATELLVLEKQQIGDAHYDGQKCAGCKHPSGNDALVYFKQTYNLSLPITPKEEITGKNTDSDQPLFYLSELIRTLSRVANKFPDVLFEDDLNRLNQAKAILAKHANINTAEILTPSAPVTENTPKAPFDRLQCERDLLLMFRGYDFPERIKSLVDYCEQINNCK